MKTTFKKIAFAVVFCVAAAVSAFAIDEDDILACEYLGQIDEEDLEAELEDVEAIQAMFEAGLGEAFNVDKFFQITADNADDEDYEFIDVLEAYIDDEYYLEDSDCFMAEALRDMTDTALDGWITFSLYSEEEGFSHYLYYFAVSMKSE